MKLHAVTRLIGALLVWASAHTNTAAMDSKGNWNASLFDYDSNTEFKTEIVYEKTVDGVVVADLQFDALLNKDGTLTKAYLVKPQGNNARHPGILWTHWLGETETTSRVQYLDEAITLAKAGFVSLLVDAMWAEPDWYTQRKLDEDFTNSVRQVIALRRSLDLLRAQAEVNSDRIAYVGHDYGAMYGILAIAADAKVDTAVLIAATSSFEDWAFYASKSDSLEAYQTENAPLNLMEALVATKDTSLFFQFAEVDQYVPLQKAYTLFEAANAPKRIQVYKNASHEMNEPDEIRADRIHWLVTRLEHGKAD